ncbi:sugar phosphate isomerase/epimerase family protein [Burkholderia gladioli]|uniref:sugar phosphate isomerase/epimerase family protein n=1 Tax=Burkholderia gladioli TaxID=28095 RepID=UPI00280B3BAA|nr:sugar phosphate isomerase/epimerase family protein [Burkholderia gladioli]
MPSRERRPCWLRSVVPDRTSRVGIDMNALKGKLARCAINTATLGHREPLGLTIDRIARAGFGGLAPWRQEVESADVRAIARQIRSLGLSVSGYCRSTYFPAATAAQRAANIDSNRRALADAAELGAACFVMVVGGIPPGHRDLDGARQQVQDGIAMLLDTARQFGVRIAIEPLHPMYAANRSVVNTIAQGLAMCEAIDADNDGHLGLAIDIYHCWWDPSLRESIARAGAARRILAYHVSDWLHDTRDLLLDRGMMGDGVVDLPGFREQVEKAGYAGMVEVEIFSRDHWWKQDPARVLEVCAARLETCC